MLDVSNSLLQSQFHNHHVKIAFVKVTDDFCFAKSINFLFSPYLACYSIWPNWSFLPSWGTLRGH